MRPRSIAVAQYSPGPVPSEPADLQRYLTEEFDKIAAAVALLRNPHFEETFVAPKKPRNGDTYLADGTSWNPGLGRGLYIYRNAVWTRIVAL